MQVAHFEPLRHQATGRGEFVLDAVVFRQRGSERDVVVFNRVMAIDDDGEAGSEGGGARR